MSSARRTRIRESGNQAPRKRRLGNRVRHSCRGSLNTKPCYIGMRCGVVCSTASRRQSEGVFAGGNSESAARRIRGVSDVTCCAALWVPESCRWRVTANRVRDSTSLTFQRSFFICHTTHGLNFVDSIAKLYPEENIALEHVESIKNVAFLSQRCEKSDSNWNHSQDINTPTGGS